MRRFEAEWTSEKGLEGAGTECTPSMAMLSVNARVGKCIVNEYVDG